MYQSEQINELFTALAKAQGQIKPAAKDSLNPHFRSKYADLGSVWEACREALASNGLSVIQTLMYNEAESPTLVTTLGHSSGQWMKSIMKLPTQKTGPQELGSCLSYCRRYMLASMVGVYSDAVDDDAEAVSKSNNQVKEKVRLPVVTKEQCTILEGFLNEFPESREGMLSKLDVTKISQIPADMFEHVVGVFEKKRQMKVDGLIDSEIGKGQDE